MNPVTQARAIHGVLRLLRAVPRLGASTTTAVHYLQVLLAAYPVSAQQDLEIQHNRYQAYCELLNLLSPCIFLEDPETLTFVGTTAEPVLVHDSLDRDSAVADGSTARSCAETPEDDNIDAFETLGAADPNFVPPVSLNAQLVQQARAKDAQHEDDSAMAEALEAREAAEADSTLTWLLTVRAIVPGFPGLTRVFNAQVQTPEGSPPPVVQFQLTTAAAVETSEPDALSLVAATMEDLADLEVRLSQHA